MNTKNCQLGRWVLLLAIFAPVWMAIPACQSSDRGNRAIAPVADDSTTARTVKSRRKQRLRQQRCERETQVQLQQVQKDLAAAKKISSAQPSPTANVAELLAREKKLTAALQNCQENNSDI
jgi:hypothetical protein